MTMPDQQAAEFWAIINRLSPENLRKLADDILTIGGDRDISDPMIEIAAAVRKLAERRESQA